MGEKILSKNIIKRNKKECFFSMSICATECIKGNYILVIGNDSILNKEVSEYDSIEKLIIDYLEPEELKIDSHRNVCNAINDLVNNNILSSQLLSKELAVLIETESFRVILTTAFDPVLELYLKDFWKKRGEQLLVKNIKDNGTSNVDLSLTDLGDNEFQTVTPTLYYVFGKAEYPVSLNQKINKFAITDNDKLELISEWMSAKAPQNLLKYMSHKRILAVGCKFDDWLFRFFWYMLHGDVGRLGEGEVAIDVKDGEYEKLNKYLVEDCKTIMFKDSKKFLSELKDTITSEKERIIESVRANREQDLDKITDNGVFLSYAHEDFWIAERIYQKLHRCGINVWMDVRLTPGDKYHKRIQYALNSCKYFIPILSTTVKSLMTNKDIGTKQYQCENRYFYKDEWYTIQNRVDAYINKGDDPDAFIKIIPITVGQYEKGKNYNDKLIGCIESSQAFEISKEPIEVLINKLQKKY